MLWQVRALLPDRPGAMAALATRCGARGANILALDVHPVRTEEVVDELVLHTPDHWTRADVEELCAEAGVTDRDVTECSARSLEDQPARYLRAAQAVVRDPDRLQELLCRMLDAGTTGASTLVLDDGAGPEVVLRRDQPFTATERARAAGLRLVAAAALESTPPAADAGATAPLPSDGLSLVLPDGAGDGPAAMGMLTLRGRVAEAALLVEDRWQRRGHGTELLRSLAAEAARMGASELVLLTRRDDTAVLATVHAAGLRAHVRCVDGVNRMRVVLPKQTADRPARRRPTEPLVALLHERQELREVYAPADIIDQAIRDGV